MSSDAEKTADFILALAHKFGVSYVSTEMDEWANHVIRLSDDEVHLDPIELLLLQLAREGYLTRSEALQLQAKYLREIL